MREKGEPPRGVRGKTEPGSASQVWPWHATRAKFVCQCCLRAENKIRARVDRGQHGPLLPTSLAGLVRTAAALAFALDDQSRRRHVGGCTAGVLREVRCLHADTGTPAGRPVHTACTCESAFSVTTRAEVAPPEDQHSHGAALANWLEMLWIAMCAALQRLIGCTGEAQHLTQPVFFIERR